MLDHAYCDVQQGDQIYDRLQMTGRGYVGRKGPNLEKTLKGSDWGKRPVHEVYPIKTSYYKVGGIETIDYIKAKLTPEQFKGYLLGNIHKYASRCQYKGEYVKDVLKLAEYTQWLKDANGPNS